MDVRKYSSNLFLALAFIFTQNVFAEPKVSYYDILKNNYKIADSSISYDDINIPGYPLNRVCIEFEESKPFTEVYVLLEKYIMNLQGQGPLLPQATIEKVFYSQINPVSPPSSYYIDMTNTQISPSGKEIVTWLTNFEGNKAWTVSLKKMDDVLIFKKDVEVKKTVSGQQEVVPVTKTTYGYCYHRETKK